jgi:putative nucleotidyltransferase with HDIG domain
VKRLPPSVRWLIVIAALSLAALTPTTALHLWRSWDWRYVGLIAIVTLLELIRVDIFPQVKGERTSFTLGSMGIFFALAIAGPYWAALGVLAQGALIMMRVRVPWYKALYTVAAITCSMWIGALVLGLAARFDAEAVRLLVVGLSGAAYVLANQFIIVLVVALSAGQNPARLWWSHFAWSTFQQWLLAVAGLSLGVAFLAAGWYALFLASPLVLIVTTYRHYAHTQKDHTRELEGFANQLITTLAAVVDARDAYTFGHSTQVSRYAVAIGREMGYGEEALERLRVGALLHDIGKVGIPEAILFKPGKLEPWEYQLMKEHAVIGYRIVSKIERLDYAADIIHQHHEWFNGQGYPRGLQGEQVLGDARIVGVADALESLMSDRPYRKGRGLEEALAEIRRWSGTQFDPRVVAALEAVAVREGDSFFVNSALLVEEQHDGFMSAVSARQQAAMAAAPTVQ